MPPSPLRSLIASARLSNLPTVWSPVLVGAALVSTDARVQAPVILLGAFVLSMLYAADMLTNDLFDETWDREHKTSRPLAMGFLSRRLSASVSGLLICASLAIASARSSNALALAGLLLVFILLYNWLHKRTPFATLLMGMCRVIVYPLSAFLLARSAGVSPLPAGFAIGLYTVLLTLAARKEDDVSARVARPLAFALPLPVLVLPLFYHPLPSPWVGTAGGAFIATTILAAMHARRGSVRTAVHLWLASFCLADAYILTILGRPTLAIACGLCFLLTLIAHRFVPGT